MKREGDYYENEMACGGGPAYPYLFWEGEDRTEYDMTKGFVVPGSETESFLREKLEFLGPK